MNRYLHTFATCFLLFAATTGAAPVKDKHVSAELISENSAIQAGTSFWVALKLVHDEHWHSYWINDGDSGLPTKIKWELPEGFTAGPIVWAFPRRIEMPPLVSFGFENEVWHLVEITPPAQIAASNITLKANVSWLMCKEICIPGKASLSLTLPVAAETQPDAELAPGFAKARLNIPTRDTDWKFSSKVTDETIELQLTPPVGAAKLETLSLFPVEKGIISSGEPQVLTAEGDSYRLVVKRDLSETTLPESFQAVLVGNISLARNPAYPAIEINILSNGAAETAASPARTYNIFFILASAFIGGIILNLMPCVFPVISLKILGFVKQSGENSRAVWHHGLVFAAGVVVSFWILAGILLAIRASGSSIGWGFQLQSPETIITLILIFFALALNLFGLFELGLSLTGAGGSLTQAQGWAGSFFSGFLATVIATPCTAPFMGVALGYALTQPPYISLLVFTSLALGMAFPYLMLSRFPALLKFLPRPGPWMETMKQIMGFFLLATVVWLFWVLSASVASSTLSWLMASLLLLSIGVWVLGRWDTLSRDMPVRWIARIIAVLFIAAASYLGFKHIETAQADTHAGDGWEMFTPERLAELQKENKPVFIDFTAKWCLTCQVNKLTVLRTQEIMQAFKEKGVTLLYADWTDENDIIARELARHGRQSVPLYLLYDGKNPEPTLLPELLTRNIVLDALKKLN